MTWTKLDDRALDHPKMTALSRSDRLLAVEALVYSNRYATDGAIPNHDLRRLSDHEDPEGSAARLVAAGLWRATDAGWQVVWGLADQPSAAEVEREREAARIRQQRKRLHDRGDHSMCDRCRVALLRRDSPRDIRRESQPPVPSRPDPVPLAGDGRDERESRFPERDVPPLSRTVSELWRVGPDHPRPKCSKCGEAAVWLHSGWCQPDPSKRSAAYAPRCDACLRAWIETANCGCDPEHPLEPIEDDDEPLTVGDQMASIFGGSSR